MIKQQIKLSHYQLFIALVIAPLLISVIYLFFIAEDQYISQTKLIIKQEKSQQTGNGILPFLTNTGNSNYQDSLLLQEYIQSNTVSEYLDDQYNLKNHYQIKRLDILSVLWFDIKEFYHKHYLQRLTVEPNEISGILTIKYRDNKTEYAQDILTSIVTHSELFINDISRKLASSQLEFAKAEHVKIQDEFTQAEQELKEFQYQNNLLTPERDVQSISSIISKLEAELTEQEVQLKKLQAYLTDNAFEVQSAKNTIRELRKKIAEEKSQFTQYNNNSNALNDVYLDFQKLTLNVDLLKEQYRVSLATLQSARSNSLKQIKYLVQIDPPSEPELSEYPRRWYLLFVIFCISLLIYGIVRLFVSAIREH